jgi:hypothetical protein
VVTGIIKGGIPMRNPDAEYFSRFAVDPESAFDGFDVFEDATLINMKMKEIYLDEIMLGEEDDLFTE